MRPRHLLPAASLLCGCAAPSAPAVVPVAPAGTITLTLDDHLGFPYELTSVRAALDGEVLHDQPHGGTPRGLRLGPVGAAPGAHAVVLDLTARYPSGSLGADCVLTVRATHAFEVSDEPTWVRASLYAKGQSEPFARRVRLAFAVNPARIDGEGVAPRTGHPSQRERAGGLGVQGARVITTAGREARCDGTEPLGDLPIDDDLDARQVPGVAPRQGASRVPARPHVRATPR